MVVKFLNDNKPKTSLKKWIHTVSNIIDFIQFHLICQILAKFLGLNPKGRYLSVQKGKEIFYVVFTCSIKRAREIRKFHVAVVQRRLRNVQKSVIHVQSCCFAYLNLLLFCHFRCRRHRRCLSSLYIVVIQKFCYHGNVTSPFSSLLAICCFELHFGIIFDWKILTLFPTQLYTSQ